jgi:hypothetical protein
VGLDFDSLRSVSLTYGSMLAESYVMMVIVAEGQFLNLLRMQFMHVSMLCERLSVKHAQDTFRFFCVCHLLFLLLLLLLSYK